MRQKDGNILNSRSGYNRCLILRLSVSVGDRVQEEIVRRADYNPADVDKILAAERGKKKVRHRTDDDEEKDEEVETSTASVVQPPLNKRRKYKTKKHVPNKASIMPEVRNRTDMVGSDSSEQTQSHDQQEPVNVQHNLRREGPASNSDQKYFPLFSQSIACPEVKKGRGRPRKPNQIKIIPPTFNYLKISDHFRHKTDYKLPNEPKDEEKRGRGG